MRYDCINRMWRRNGVGKSNARCASRWSWWRRRGRWRRRCGRWLWARRTAGSRIESAVENGWTWLADLTYKQYIGLTVAHSTMGKHGPQIILTVSDFEPIALFVGDDVCIAVHAAELSSGPFYPTDIPRATPRKGIRGRCPSKYIFTRRVGNELADAISWCAALLCNLPPKMLPLGTLPGLAHSSMHRGSQRPACTSRGCLLQWTERTNQNLLFAMLLLPSGRCVLHPDTRKEIRGTPPTDVSRCPQPFAPGSSL